MGGAVRGIGNMARGIFGSLFGGGDNIPPGIVSSIATPPAPPPPTMADPSIQDAERRQRMAAAKAEGREDTIKTGGEGVTEDEEKLYKASRYLG